MLKFLLFFRQVNAHRLLKLLAFTILGEDCYGGVDGDSNDLGISIIYLKYNNIHPS